MEEKLEEYLKTLDSLKTRAGYSKKEQFINLPLDEKNISEIMESVKEIKKTHFLKDLVIIGIGGSSLGTKAIYEALKTTNTLPKIHFLNQINLEKIAKTADTLNKKGENETLLIVVSKSGSTFETRKNYELLEKELKNEIKTIFITGKDSVLAQENKNQTILNIPENVGGRFSIFSPVGLFPLALTNVDILELLKGGMDARKISLQTKENPTAETAAITWQNYKEGREIYNIFIFSPRLKTLGYWYQQLLGESLGKNEKGLFPVVTEGSKDLHSLQQYFVGGKKSVQHEFIISQEENRYQRTILKAVQKTYQQNNIPFKNTILPAINEFHLGKFMQDKMIEVLFLAKLLGINPFGQPDVESYKKNTEKLLSYENN